MTPEQIAKYKELHYESQKLLLELVGGHVDMNTPQEITHPQASCLIASVIANEIDQLSIINEAEGK